MITKEDIGKLVPSSGERFDVIVAGAGPAGLGAAAAAARQGAHTDPDPYLDGFFD